MAENPTPPPVGIPSDPDLTSASLPSLESSGGATPTGSGTDSLSGAPESAGSSQTPETPVAPAKPPWWRPTKRWALLGIPILILIVAIIAAFLIFHRAPITTQPGSSTPPSIDPQALGPDAIKQLNDASAIAGSLQTLNIAPNTVFKNNLTVQGNTSLAKNLFVGGDLSVSGASNLQGPVTAGSGLTVQGPLNVTGTTSLSGNLSVGGSLTIGGTLNVGNLTATTVTSTGTLTVEGHFAAGGSTPTIQPDVATTGGTVAITGSDTAGTVTITTGPGAPAAGEMALITFHAAYPGTPKVFLTPVSLTSASLHYFVSQSPTFFSVETANLPTAGTVYSFNYFVVQ